VHERNGGLSPWLLLLVPIITAASIVYWRLGPFTAQAESVICPASCTVNGAPVNRFGFSPTSGYSLLKADNYVLSWQKAAEWVPGATQDRILREDFAYAAANNATPLLTVEPWPSRGHSSRTLLADITDGVYDREISWLCSSIRDYGAPVLVRWGHEMENITGRYPWATRDAPAYIGAYRHFVERCRELAQNAQYMWSPAGNKNLSDYWPGTDYVDYIGLTVYDYEAWEVRYYGYNRTFKENFDERYYRINGYNKPVIIAEFGATGEHREAWIHSALTQALEYPLVKGILFFSALDPVTWGPLPAPDWRKGQGD